MPPCCNGKALVNKFEKPVCRVLAYFSKKCTGIALPTSIYCQKMTRLSACAFALNGISFCTLSCFFVTSISTPKRALKYDDIQRTLLIL